MFDPKATRWKMATAILNNDRATVRRMVSEGVSPLVLEEEPKSEKEEEEEAANTANEEKKRGGEGTTVTSTALHCACENDNVELAQDLFLGYPWLLNMPDKHGDMPFHVAAMNRSTQTLLRLLKVTAVPPMDVRPHDPSEQPQTYFELLSDELIFLIFKQLHPLSELPTVSQVCRRFCHIAGDPHLRTFLSIEASNRRGQRLVHMAAQQGLAEVVAALIELKADIHARNRLHITPLFLAAEHGRHEILELLIAAGGNVHDRDSNNHTPLHAAAWGCHSRCVILRMKHGASALAVDDKGDTPLSSALKYGSLSPASCSTSSFLLAFSDPTKEARMEQERKLVRGLLAKCEAAEAKAKGGGSNRGGEEGSKGSGGGGNESGMSGGVEEAVGLAIKSLEIEEAEEKMKNEKKVKKKKKNKKKKNNKKLNII